MKIGFTGTQKGATRQQVIEVDGYLRGLHILQPIDEVHHGDCVGADSQFHAHLIAHLFGYKAYDLIYIHPPENERKRAWCYSKHIFIPKPYIERNHDIVDAVDLMIATPAQHNEVLRSGTWATIRYARKRGVKCHIIYP